MKTYTASYDHSSCSYGHPVLIDDDGNTCGPAAVGLWGNLPSTIRGRVDTPEMPHPEWSGDGDAPDKRWKALCRILKRTDHRKITVEDAGKVLVHD